MGRRRGAPLEEEAGWQEEGEEERALRSWVAAAMKEQNARSREPRLKVSTRVVAVAVLVAGRVWWGWGRKRWTRAVVLGRLWGRARSMVSMMI